jgi:tight adherence protein C
MNLPHLLSGQLPVEILAGLANFAVLVALYRAFAPADGVSQRARNHAKRRKELRRAFLTAPRVVAQRRQQSVNLLRSLLDKLKLTRGEEVRKATDFLSRAGWRSPDALTVFLGARLAAPVGLGVLVFLLAPEFLHHLTPPTRLLAAAFGIAAGMFGPSVFVNNAGHKRQQKIQQGLPDALDLFVICTEAGLGLDSAITRVARELGATAPELADELGLTAIELGFLPDRRDALVNLGKRTDTPAIRALVNTLVQTERYGTPLAQSLRVLANEFRTGRMMRAEEKAARLPAMLTVPMIVFVLPPLFIVLIGPALIQVLAALHR